MHGTRRERVDSFEGAGYLIPHISLVYFVPGSVCVFSSLINSCPLLARTIANIDPLFNKQLEKMQTGQKAPMELTAWRKKLSKAEPVSISRQVFPHSR